MSLDTYPPMGLGKENRRDAALDLSSGSSRTHVNPWVQQIKNTFRHTASHELVEARMVVHESRKQG